MSVSNDCTSECDLPRRDPRDARAAGGTTSDGSPSSESALYHGLRVTVERRTEDPRAESEVGIFAAARSCRWSTWGPWRHRTIICVGTSASRRQPGPSAATDQPVYVAATGKELYPCVYTKQVRTQRTQEALMHPTEMVVRPGEIAPAVLHAAGRRSPARRLDPSARGAII